MMQKTCSHILFYLVAFNGKIRSPLGSGAGVHIIKGAQNESFIIYVLEIGFMEPNGSISLLQAKEHRKRGAVLQRGNKVKGLASVGFPGFNNKIDQGDATIL